ncbi:MAG: flavin reductase family protein [Geodermatophilaceae bacterium]|jgi:flavin reductase (DIM6/NTAB) family NADH-FMN oxidoreductase RutF|nr:flavin reductase family protein [Geodermatophilaceae bacterium]
MYSILTSIVVPRPIAWVSTRSADGIDNLAPHSFYTVACVNPPVVQFTSVGRKDSLRNVEETREFVINLTTESLFEQVNATGTDFPIEQSEFEVVGIPMEPAETVAPYRVASSPAAIECELHSTLTLGDSTVIFGRVRLVAISESVLRNGRPAVDLLAPLSRLGGNDWATVGALRRIARLGYEKWNEQHPTTYGA